MIARLGRLAGSLSAKQRIAIGVAALIVIAGIVIAIAVPSHSPVHSAAPPSSSTSTTVPVTTTTGLSVAPGYCPLTDEHAPNGVPDRPALAVKVGNEPDGARPQSGLNEADIVFDTPAEGFIMRYIAVYQCTDASQIGPDRSVRWVDWHLTRQFHNPILAYAGGIGHNLKIVSSFKWEQADNILGNAAGAGIRTTNRVAPDNLYTSTAALYGFSPAFDKKYGPPPPIFRYSATVPAGSTPAASMHINFSYDTDVIWTWDPPIGQYVHSYTSGPDIDALTNTPVSASNVVVLVVHYKFGPYAEHIGGSGDFESQTLGNGTGYILRNGRAIKMTWNRRYITEPWTFTGPGGERLALSPGRTWVELVPITTAHAAEAFGITP